MIFFKKKAKPPPPPKKEPPKMKKEKAVSTPRPVKEGKKILTAEGWNRKQIREQRGKTF